MIISILVAMFTSLLVGALLIRYNYVHSRFSSDHTNGPQKFHTHKAIRLGGVPLLFGFALGVFYQGFRYEMIPGLLFLAVCLPIFGTGLIEDMTRKVKPLTRLLAAFFSAFLGVVLLSATLTRLDITFIDSLIYSSPAIAALFTVIFIGGVTHAFNIIDGYNGLSGMVTILILVGLGYVSFKVNDFYLAGLCASMIGAIIGFLFWNFPKGHIFAGDSGAYLMGFVVAEISVLLVYRNSTVSPWFPLLLVIYPVFETAFSMYRRRLLQGRSVAYPDALHLHSMIYRRLVRGMIGRYEQHSTSKNSMTSPYLWCVTITTLIPAVLFWNNSYLLISFTLLFTAIYIWLYRRIVHFRTPKILVIRLKTKSN